MISERMYTALVKRARADHEEAIEKANKDYDKKLKDAWKKYTGGD